jgi:hypothetical protein
MLAFGWFGALIVTRVPVHPIGWIMCGLGLSTLEAFVTEYAVYGLVRRPGTLPGGAAASFESGAVPAVLLGLLAALLVVYPTGAPPSRRWRWVLWLAAGAFLFTTAANLSLWSARGMDFLLVFGDAEPDGAAYIAYSSGFFGALAAIVAGLASLFVRFRRAGPTERAQLMLVLMAVLGLVIGLPVLLAVSNVLSASEYVATRSSVC